jgi:beta-barrel assembly-enhancing protease
MRSSRILMALVIAAIGGLYYYCNQQVNPVTGEKQRVAMTPDQEVALGLQTAPQMAQEFGGLHPDEQLQSYVEGIGEQIVSGSAARGSGYQYDFHLLADPETVNAFALPGGQIFITAALLSRLQDESQLAGVLGHEIGHVVGRHSAEHLAKAQLTQILVGAAGVAASGEGSDGQQAAAVAAVVGQVVNMKFGRKDELESDRFGVRFMGEAGYDPRALKEVMRILAEASGGSPRPEFLSTHPDPGNRLEEIDGEIARLYPNGVPPNLTRGDPGRFSALKARL